MFLWMGPFMFPNDKQSIPLGSLIPVLNDKFVLRPPLDKDHEEAVSFEFKRKKNATIPKFLRAQETKCFIESFKHDEDFSKYFIILLNHTNFI